MGSFFFFFKGGFDFFLNVFLRVRGDFEFVLGFVFFCFLGFVDACWEGLDVIWVVFRCFPGFGF